MKKSGLRFTQQTFSLSRYEQVNYAWRQVLERFFDWPTKKKKQKIIS
jgi:hypothetical protein